MISTKISLSQLIEKVQGRFSIPAYQRRYGWGEPRTDGSADAATRLMSDLLEAYARCEDYFLQGITLSDNDLVDGQQRLTFLLLLLGRLGHPDAFTIEYACRPAAQAWMQGHRGPGAAQCQDVYYFEKTLKIINSMMTADEAGNSAMAKSDGASRPAVAIGEPSSVNLADESERARFYDYILHRVYFLCIEADGHREALVAYKMLNGTKSQMQQADLVKARILSLFRGSDDDWRAEAARNRYAAEWEDWSRWWNSQDSREFFRQDWAVGTEAIAPQPIDLLLRLCLRRKSDKGALEPLAYEEFSRFVSQQKEPPQTIAMRFFSRLRLAQKRFEDALSTPARYNRIRAILLLQDAKSRFDFLHDYFVTAGIGPDALQDIYKYSFLGMTYDEIIKTESAMARFDELLASLSQADVYHTESKRDAFNLLLRLNIDEDIKLNRRFDFSIWNNRSLEHIYSKSKVWHRTVDGRPVDGNDNDLPMSPRQLQADPTFMCRDEISNYDGAPLSEHCIGNLVLLYGQNNAAFGNASFAQKKMMFLAPGDMGVFQSRNLLHSVCVFAGNEWSHRQIVDNYNLTLKNLKLYYGFK